MKFSNMFPCVLGQGQRFFGREKFDGKFSLMTPYLSPLPACLKSPWVALSPAIAPSPLNISDPLGLAASYLSPFLAVKSCIFVDSLVISPLPLSRSLLSLGWC